MLLHCYPVQQDGQPGHIVVCGRPGQAPQQTLYTYIRARAPVKQERGQVHSEELSSCGHRPAPLPFASDGVHFLKYDQRLREDRGVEAIAEREVCGSCSGKLRRFAYARPH